MILVAFRAHTLSFYFCDVWQGHSNTVIYSYIQKKNNQISIWASLAFTSDDIYIFCRMYFCAFDYSHRLSNKCLRALQVSSRQANKSKNKFPELILCMILNNSLSSFLNSYSLLKGQILIHIYLITRWNFYIR